MRVCQILSLLLALLSLIGCAGRANPRASSASTAPSETTGNYVVLLGNDRGDLANWEMYSQDKIEGWTFANGELTASGAGWDARKDLVTKRDYRNFDLTLEWKIDSANSSGIFYLVPKDGVHEIYELAPEYQVIDDANWPSVLEPNQQVAGNYAMHEASEDARKPFGQWNTARIVVRQPKVEHWLNGRKVVEYTIDDADWRARKAAGKWSTVDDYAKATSGRIGLQNAGKVTYRNIKIREL